MGQVVYNGIKFDLFIPSESIQTRVRQIASAISDDYENKRPLIICVLNGAFAFASDMFMNLSIDAEITFTRLKSYVGTGSSGSVDELLELSDDIRDRHVVVVEDIIDTGRTIKKLIDSIKLKLPASVRVATLLYKPQVCTHDITPDYIGFTIPSKFIIGYGLDIDGLGRNLKDIWVAEEEN